jgi:uncharacterized protein (TIGR00303 family)
VVLQLTGDADQAERWAKQMAAGWQDALVVLLLAGTDTAAVPGISAAGATPDSRRRTAAADAELLLLGPDTPRPHALPPLPAGVSPALISHVVVRELQPTPLVVDLGCPVAPAVPHIRLGQQPALCLSSGRAMGEERVLALLALGQRWARAWQQRWQEAPQVPPLVLAECVPGGTSTAQAVLTGLGVAAGGLVSGSLLTPAHGLKAALVDQGLRAAGLAMAGEADVNPVRVAAAVGDPMQPLAAGMLLAAAEGRWPVLLAGGSQMAAVLALALALADAPLRTRLVAAAALGTTGWVAREPSSDLALLLQRVADRWRVAPPACFATQLCFSSCRSPALQDYERGYVKEGVGAGGLALLWEWSGRSPAGLAAACDRAQERLIASL